MLIGIIEKPKEVEQPLVSQEKSNKALAHMIYQKFMQLIQDYRKLILFHLTITTLTITIIIYKLANKLKVLSKDLSLTSLLL